MVHVFYKDFYAAAVPRHHRPDYEMVQIRFSPTPNPNSLKFTLDEGTFVESGMESFSTPEEAENHSLGSRLFSISGIVNVFILPQFLTITKHPAADWDQLIPEIESVINSSLEGD